MNTTSLCRRITKYVAGTVAILLILTTVMVSVSVRTEAYIWPDRELQLGMTGEDVLSLQTRLAEFGIEVGELDGYFGEVTQNALMIYQYYAGLYVDGVAGPITLTSMYGPRDNGSAGNTDALVGATDEGSNQESTSGNLMIGSNGANVTLLQNTLEGLGYATGGVDGIFGSKTEAAVIAFQQANGLYVDGIAGPLTIAALSSPSAVRYGQNSSQNTNDQGSNSQNTNNNGNPADNVSITSISRELRKGMSGSDIMALQNALDALGFNTGGADGDFGSMTEAAVMAFQQAKGLLADGIVGPITLAALTETEKPVEESREETPGQTRWLEGSVMDGALVFYRLLAKGMEGDDVRNLQQRLFDLGYLEYSPDGIFDLRTEAALIAFQKDHGLYADGLVGSQTAEALNWRHFLDEPVISGLADGAILTEKCYSREGQPIRFIIPHHMAARYTGAGCAAYFTTNTAGTSANYCIGYDGDIVQNVPEQYGAWTSGDVNFDRQAITVEISDTAINNYRIPQAAQDAFVNLCVDLVLRNPSLGGRLVYDPEDEARVIAAKYGYGSWDDIRGNVLIHCWTTTAGTTCPEWHMKEILPELIDRVNSILEQLE